LGIYKSGTATSETLNLLAAVHYETSIDSGKFFAQQALEYAKSTDNKAQIGESYYQLGDAAYYSGQTDSVFYFYSKSLEYYHQTDKNNEIAAVYNDIGQVLQMMNYNDSATLYFDLAMDYIEKEVLPEGYYSILINKGTSLYAKGSYALANEAFLRVINLGYYALSAERLAAVYSNLGLSYKRTSNFNQAIFYYQKAFQIDDSLGFQYNKAIDLANIGGVYFTWKQYEEALNYFKRSLEIYESYGKERNISSILSNIAAAQKGLNLLSEAQFNYDRALKLALKLPNSFCLSWFGNVGF
jgi:tetratricopeptide (TPR) repeat protein